MGHHEAYAVEVELSTVITGLCVVRRRPVNMILGISGHQDLGTAEVRAWATTALRELMARQPVEMGLTCLADGTDQLFAELCLAMGIAYQAVVPCELYEDSFVDNAARARFHTLVAQAQKVHRLPFSSPSEEAFFAAGKWIVTHCDMLIAVWNGLAAKGLGGTGDVVKYAESATCQIVHVNPISRTTALLPRRLMT
jgi:hypothetical protein